VPERPGPIETLDGRRLGTHRGLPFYTLGQRAGLGIGGRADAAAEPWYVARKDPERNALLVAQRREPRALETCALRCGPVNWLAPVPELGFEAGVKVRYRQADQAARLEPDGRGGIVARFEAPQRAVTPGQYAVFYAGPRCLGGAVIEETL